MMLTNHSRNEADLVKIAGKNVNISHLMPAQDRRVLVMFKASPSPHTWAQHNWWFSLWSQR